MEKIVKLFGEKVVGKNGDVKTTDLCGDKKLIGVYFSAHWCPPCRGFTPVLAKKYDVWKKAGKQFEVIFVSSDRDKKNFDDYYKEMPWLTIPYDDEDRRNSLSETFEVEGIPTLVILDGKTGAVISEDATGDVGESDDFPSGWNSDPVNILDLVGPKVKGSSGDVETASFCGEGKVNSLSETFEVEGIPTLVILDGKTGAVISEDATGDVGESDDFPSGWNSDPVNILDLVGPKVKGSSGDVETASFCGEGKVVGLYFSAHWCPPCRGFTPALAEKYKKWKADGANFEIVFISSDRDEKSFNEYFAEMPWLAMDYADREKKGQCSSKFGVSGIPTLIILDGNTGEIITKDGRAKVMGSEGYPDWKA